MRKEEIKKAYNELENSIKHFYSIVADDIIDIIYLRGKLDEEMESYGVVVLSIDYTLIDDLECIRKIMYSDAGFLYFLYENETLDDTWHEFEGLCYEDMYGIWDKLNK